MNNLSSYCGLVDAKIRASDKDLPVTTSEMIISTNNFIFLQLKNTIGYVFCAPSFQLSAVTTERSGNF
jgi:hypothetical protein